MYFAPCALIQANFHFLLHAPATERWSSDGKEASLGLQEAFFDPDVLVDWDTVDTVRLMRKVARRPPTAAASKPIAPDVSGGVPYAAPGVVIEANGSPNLTTAKAAAGKTRSTEITWGSATKKTHSSLGAAKGKPADSSSLSSTTDVSSRNSNSVGVEQEESGSDDDWRCPICLIRPLAPRMTKCGHGPFCLVCILRHLKGEASARCPLCFENMHR